MNDNEDNRDVSIDEALTKYPFLKDISQPNISKLLAELMKMMLLRDTHFLRSIVAVAKGE